MKGFTLIELLAIIVILAVILLIALPVISGVIESVKEGAFSSSIDLIKQATTNEYLNRNLNGDVREVKYVFNDSVQTVTPADVDKLDFNGNGPKNGYILVTRNGDVEVVVTDGSYFIQTDISGKLKEAVVYDPAIHDSLLIGEVLWTGPFTFEVTIPVGGRTFSFGAVDANLTINWGDTVEETFTHAGADYITHTYAEGVYEVTVTGTSSQISFCRIVDYVFANCLGTPTLLSDILSPIPVSMGLTNAHAMFAETTIESFTRADFFDQASANITNFSFMFNQAFNFNGEINSWDTSNATDMSYMFGGATQFNQPLSNFDTSKVVDFNVMFAMAENFDQDISSWDVSSATHMQSMFGGAYAFNQNIGSWDVSNVEYIDSIFHSALSFNQDISSWDVSNVVDMDYLFYIATSFNQDLSGWCVSQFSSLPFYFDENATSWLLPKPVWGTCP